MRVLVCGGRDFDDYKLIRQALDPLYLADKVDCFAVIQGGATGADKLARDWCVNRGVDYLNFAADWKQYGRAAGPLRNARMIAEGRPDLVLAFPGGRGTADMVAKARAAGIPVRQVSA